MDAAGVIDEVGPDVEGWSVGDEVMAIALPLTGHGGAYVEYLVAPVGSFTRIPRGTTIEAASTVPMNGLTAIQMLELAGLERGQTLAVTGAAGLLGNYVVQLAKAAGITVIADSSEKDQALVRSLGPDHIVPRGDDFAASVRAVVPEGGRRPVRLRPAAGHRRPGHPRGWCVRRRPRLGGQRRTRHPVRAGVRVQ
ncbi:hypothetical protein [Curtobacterium sp. MCJR17_043]|uniref:alcohol dehydrogenase catalytic domain-containing protein n=1 Tax=Curtobacterium sp. MCJR17_043 TaxID=2175660 RepID=UPI0024E03609|nr:hypothetical protein [Curtobacterium sp. MCJR17_043]WIB36936.1 hypothetical protein DEJ15_08285 [Curtobacterium sp. MCJR17_043]